MSVPRFGIGISQTRGLREYMEDYVCTSKLAKNKAIIGVFDGHNGKESAEIVSDIVCNKAVKYSLYDDINFINLFNDLQKEVEKQTESGSTGVILYLGMDVVRMAYVGDSSVYLVKNDGVQRITTPHNCNNEEEVKRIEEEGGNIEEVNGMKRVNGIINVTRTIGDKKLHPPLTCEPDVKTINTKGCSHIIITTDGADTVDMNELEKIIKRSPTAMIAASAIRNEAMKQKSDDNISVVVVDLKYCNYDKKTYSPLMDDLCIAGGDDEENPFD